MVMLRMNPAKMSRKRRLLAAMMNPQLRYCLLKRLIFRFFYYLYYEIALDSFLNLLFALPCFNTSFINDRETLSLSIMLLPLFLVLLNYFAVSWSSCSGATIELLSEYPPPFISSNAESSPAYIGTL